MSLNSHNSFKEEVSLPSCTDKILDSRRLSDMLRWHSSQVVKLTYSVNVCESLLFTRHWNKPQKYWNEKEVSLYSRTSSPKTKDLQADYVIRWQNVVHWRREWQTTSVFLPWEPMNTMKNKKIGHWKMNSPGLEVPNMLLEISGEITPERMKRRSQGKNNTQLWMWLVTEARPNAVRSNIK